MILKWLVSAYQLPHRQPAFTSGWASTGPFIRFQDVWATMKWSTFLERLMEQIMCSENQLCVHCKKQNSLLEVASTLHSAVFHLPQLFLSQSPRIGALALNLGHRGQHTVFHVQPKKAVHILPSIHRWYPTCWGNLLYKSAVADFLVYTAIYC